MGGNSQLFNIVNKLSNNWLKLRPQGAKPPVKWRFRMGNYAFRNMSNVEIRRFIYNSLQEIEFHPDREGGILITIMECIQENLPAIEAGTNS